MINISVFLIFIGFNSKHIFLTWISHFGSKDKWLNPPNTALNTSISVNVSFLLNSNLNVRIFNRFQLFTIISRLFSLIIVFICLFQYLTYIIFPKWVKWFLFHFFWRNLDFVIFIIVFVALNCGRGEIIFCRVANAASWSNFYRAKCICVYLNRISFRKYPWRLRSFTLWIYIHIRINRWRLRPLKIF